MSRERRLFPSVSRWLGKRRVADHESTAHLAPRDISIRAIGIDEHGRMPSIQAVETRLKAELEGTGQKLADSKVRAWIIAHSQGVQCELNVDTFTRLVFLGDKVDGAWTTAGYDDARRIFHPTTGLQQWFSWNSRGVVVLVPEASETPRSS